MSSLFGLPIAISSTQEDTDNLVIFVSKVDYISDEEFVIMNVEDFANEHNLDMTHIHALDDIFAPAALYYPKIPIIAGGYLRRWFTGEDFHQEMDCDIDVYCRAAPYSMLEESAKKAPPQEYVAREAFIKYLDNSYEPTKPSEYGFNHVVGKVDYKGKVFEVQVMQRSFVLKYSMSVKDLLRTYDMTISMIGYDPQSREITYHKNFIQMNKDRVMDFNTSARINSPATQMARFVKMSDEGYTAQPGLYRKFCDWTYSSYNANGGTSPGDQYGDRG